MLNLYFSHRYRKLSQSHFTTIRLSRGYWAQKVGDRVNVFLRNGDKNQFLGVAQLYYLDSKPWREIPESLVYEDIGLSKTKAYLIFRAWYKNKPQWQGPNTLFDILFLKWIR